jgi:hypothetical protein
MQHEILTKLRIKPSTLGWGCAVLVGFAFAYPSIKAHQSAIAIDREDNTKRELKASSLERELEFEQRQAAVANKRYESCLPVVGEFMRNNTHYFTGLREGDIPVDRITKKSLPKGTVICDAHGNSGVIDDAGKVAFTAYTGDRDLVQKRLARFKGSQYSQPVIGGN